MSEVFKCDGVELGKRTYTGVLISRSCRNEKCENIIEWDGYRQYLSYPVVGEKEKIYLYCGVCGEEWKLEAKLEMTLTVGEDCE
jgi:hypothetical protein